MSPEITENLVDKLNRKRFRSRRTTPINQKYSAILSGQGKNDIETPKDLNDIIDKHSCYIHYTNKTNHTRGRYMCNTCQRICPYNIPKKNY